VSERVLSARLMQTSHAPPRPSLGASQLTSNHSTMRCLEVSSPDVDTWPDRRHQASIVLTKNNYQGSLGSRRKKTLSDRCHTEQRRMRAVGPRSLAVRPASRARPLLLQSSTTATASNCSLAHHSAALYHCPFTSPNCDYLSLSSPPSPSTITNPTHKNPQALDSPEVALFSAISSSDLEPLLVSPSLHPSPLD
jgi:hypothetical protein